jgi:uncharacterized protein YbbK (DUF523 family)
MAGLGVPRMPIHLTGSGQEVHAGERACATGAGMT